MLLRHDLKHFGEVTPLGRHLALFQIYNIESPLFDLFQCVNIVRRIVTNKSFRDNQRARISKFYVEETVLAGQKGRVRKRNCTLLTRRSSE